MTFAEFIGCTLISFGPAFAIFCLVVTKDPIRIIIMISGSFFWLLSLLLSSILWAAVVPLKEYLIFAVTFSVIFQEGFRYLFYRILRKAEYGLQKVSDVGTKGGSHQSRSQLALVSGLGFGVMSGAFSITNILADAAGPGTVGINDDSQFFYLFSALTTLCFILFHICWTVILFHSCDHKKHVMTLYVLLSHLAASYITFLNPKPKQLYAVSIPLEFVLLFVTGVFALKCAGFNFQRAQAQRADAL